MLPFRYHWKKNCAVGLSMAAIIIGKYVSQCVHKSMSQYVWESVCTGVSEYVCMSQRAIEHPCIDLHPSAVLKATCSALLYSVYMFNICHHYEPKTIIS